MRVHGLGFGDGAVAAIRSLPGVRAVTPWTETVSATVRPGRTGDADPPEQQVTLFGTEPIALARVQAGLVGSARDAPAGLVLGAGSVAPQDVRVLTAAEAGRLEPGSDADPLPLLVGGEVAPVGTRVTLRTGARTVAAVVAVRADGLVGTPAGDAWVVASLPALRARTGLVLAPQELLIDGRPLPSDAAVTGVVDGVGSIRRVVEIAGTLAGNPLADAVRELLPRTLAVGGLLAVASVVLTLLLGARARGRFVAHLRAVGLSGRQVGALVALEVVPVAVGGLLGGLAGGVLLSWLVLPVADLRPLTGSPLPPPVLVPALPVALIGLGYVVVVGAGIVAAARAGRSVSPAQAARTVEEG
jgi:putative ABC transport system permease protein